MSISPAALREIHQLQTEASQLLDKRELTRADSKRSDLLMAKIASIKQVGLSGDEIRQHLAAGLAKELGLPQPDFSDRANPEQRAHEELFKRFLSGVPDAALEAELRTSNNFLAGTQTLNFTAGPQGGILVPWSFQKGLVEGLAAIDPLFDENVCTVIQEKGLALPPLHLPAWDLTTIKATVVNEAAQHASDVVPPLSHFILNKYTYRLSLGASLEFEQDQRSFDSTLAIMARAFGIGFSRGIGADLVTGTGTSTPQGIIAGISAEGIASSYTTAAAGVITADDIEAVYFGVNKIYRSSPKCAWLMNDAAYQLVRKAKDTSLRPLIDIENDNLKLMGKPVYITPSLPTTTGQAGSFCVFGDLSHYYVHASTLYLRRNLQVPGYVENGMAVFTGLLSVDTTLFSPGVAQPIIAATLHV